MYNRNKNIDINIRYYYEKIEENLFTDKLQKFCFILLAIIISNRYVSNFPFPCNF